MTQAPTPGPLSDAERYEQAKRDFNRMRDDGSLPAPAPVEASGSERDRIAKVLRERVQIGGTDWDKSAYGADMNAEEVADAILSTRPQPSGETREAVARLVDPIAWDDGQYAEPGGRGQQWSKDMALKKTDAILALLSARPLALGGQQGEFSVEEYVADYEFRADGEGGCYTPTENERALLIDAIHGALSEFSLSTTPARAEAQDEGVAGEAVAWRWRNRPDGVWNYQEARQRIENVEQQPLYAHPSPTQGAAGEVVTALLGAAGFYEAAGLPITAERLLGLAERHSAHPSPPPAADEDRVRAAVLKGVGKVNGDGWKDTTTKGEVVFVWNTEKPAPYAPGQYPRVGNEVWSASTAQYDFAPATADDVPAILAALKGDA